MNVSIASVVQDLDTTVSGVQSAIALEALVSAAFILIGSKVGDLIGRKRAYVLGLLGYAVGALAMTLAQSLTAIIIFWAVVGGIGASLLLPAMQSLIHGNFEERPRPRPTRSSGRRRRSPPPSGRCSAGSSPPICRGGSGSCSRSSSSPSCCPASGSSVTPPTPASGRRRGRRRPLGPGHRRRRARHPGVAGRGESVAALLAVGVVGLAALVVWLRRRKRQGKPTLLDPDLFKSKHFRQDLPAVAP